MFEGSNAAECDGFLRAIEIRSTLSFGEEVKPSAPCPKILRHFIDPCGIWHAYSTGKINVHFSTKFPLLRYYMSVLVFARDLWRMN
jgi:hypothetical protein